MKISLDKKISGSLILAASLICSCSEDSQTISGEGRLAMTASIEATARSYSQQQLADSCVVYISNTNGVIRKYKGVDNIPSEIWLATDNYVAEAWSGDSVSASFDKKFYKAVQPFTINKDATTPVTLNCTLANVVVSVSYDTEVTDALQDFSMKVQHTRGSLTFEGNDSRQGYFMMPSGVNDLTWILSGTTFDGKPFTKKGTITNVKPATNYEIEVKYSGNLPDQGGAMFNFSVNETAIEIKHDVPINNAPIIEGVDFDINNPLTCTKGAVGRRAIIVTSPTLLSSFTVSCDTLTALGFNADSYELLPIDDTMCDYMLHKGINYLYRTYDDNSSNFVLNFSQKLCDMLPVGNYAIEIKATDVDGLSRNTTLNLIINPKE